MAATNPTNPITITEGTYLRESRSFQTKSASSPTVMVRQGGQFSFSSVGVPSGTGANITTYYSKRWRDSGAPSTHYVFLVTSEITQAYPFAPPFGGPLVHETVIDTWQD